MPAAATGVLVVLLALFAYAIGQRNATERSDAERRFTDRAAVTAALTEAIFSASAGQAATDNARRHGDEVDVRALDRQLEQGSVKYLVALDRQGNVIGASSGTPPEALERLENRPPAIVQKALKGAPFALSDFVETEQGGGVIEYASPYEGEDGRRVMVSGFDGQLIAAFLGAYLGSIPDSDRASAYVVDSQGRVVGSPVKGQLAGRAVTEPGLAQALEGPSRFEKYTSGAEERALTAVPVRNSTWRVVLTETTAELYRAAGSPVAWLILVALALAGLAVVLLISRLTRAAVEVHVANEQLERSNEDLAHSNRELQRSNSELEQFAAVASHDLQEPLRKVQTFGDQIERRFGDQMPDEAIDYLRRMRSSANRMSTLIEDLLRFSRVTTHAAAPAEVDLAEVARQVTSDLDALLAETGGRVEIGALPAVTADPLQMRQLLQNLIANGVKFHRPGVPPVVELRPVPAEPGMTGFAVADNGIGFEEKYAERIFRVFERLHPRDVFEGTGIGLALCRKIVERHGGTIVAEGRPDEGSTFVIMLPVPVRPGGAQPGGQEARVPAHA